MIPTLRTDRLTLRAPQADDFAPFAALAAADNPGFLGGLSRKDAAHAFAIEVAGWITHGTGKWTVALTADGTPVGMTGVVRFPHFPEPEIGWMLFPGHRGRGYATEAATAARDWAREAGIPSLVSYVSPGNAASIAVAERLGATPDPDAPYPDGEGPEETAIYRHWGAA